MGEGGRGWRGESKKFGDGMKEQKGRKNGGEEIKIKIIFKINKIISD